MAGNDREAASETSRQDARPNGTDLMPVEKSDYFEGLTPAQREKAVAVAKKARDRADAPPMTLAMKGDVLKVGYEHENLTAVDALTMSELGTCDPHFHVGVIGQIAIIGSQGKRIDEGNSNFLLSVVRAVQPRDELETLLALQMGAIHAATMMLARRLNHVETIPQQDAAERALNKLARTYAMQMETFKRYRTGGQQKVVVEHVTVNEGGQAIVGAVTQGGRG